MVVTSGGDSLPTSEDPTSQVPSSSEEELSKVKGVRFVGQNLVWNEVEGTQSYKIRKMADGKFQIIPN